MILSLSFDGSDEDSEPNWWARGESGENENVCEKSAEDRAVDEVRSVVEGNTDCPGDDAGDKSHSQASLGFVPLLSLQVVVVIIVVAVIACIVACSSAGVQGARGLWRGLIVVF